MHSQLPLFDDVPVPEPTSILFCEVLAGVEQENESVGHGQFLYSMDDVDEDGTLDPDDFRNRVQALARSRGHFFGYPIPVPDAELVLAKQFPYQNLGGMKMRDDENELSDERKARLKELLSESNLSPENQKTMALIIDTADSGFIQDFMSVCIDKQFKVINSWFSKKLNRQVAIVYDTHSKKYKVTIDDVADIIQTKWNMLIGTALAAINAWDIRAEYRALAHLRTLIPDHLFCSYMTAGAFPESSKRSGLCYLFRKGKPTIVTRDDKPITTLCLHPIAYYKGTFAGGMVPTDDVIAHLLMMRGDEHAYWKRSNQHALHTIESGY